MAAAAAVIGTVDGDADALMTCEQTSGILTPDQNIYAVTVQIQRALQEADRGSELSVRPGVRRLMMPISQRLYRPTAPRNSNLLSVTLNSILASASAAVRRGNVGWCVAAVLAGHSTLSIRVVTGQAHPALCSGLNLSTEYWCAFAT